MKRILFTTTNLGVPSGGSEMLWSKAAKSMASHDGYSVGALLKNWSPVPNHVVELADNGVKLFFFPDTAAIPISKEKILVNRLLPSHLQFKPQESKPQFEDLEDFNPDLVVVSFGDLFQDSFVTKFLIEKRIPYITIIQLVGEFSLKNDYYIQRSLEYFENSLMNCFLSRKNIDLAEQLLGAKIPNLAIVKNPCSESPAYLPYPSTMNGYRLAFPARMHTLHKGLDILLKVMSHEKWKERNLVVNCFGDGPNKEQLNRLKSMWKVENVNFLPYTDDIAEVWRNHHALVMSSRMEGHPLVAVEAMACGRMVITTNVGAGDEFVTQHKNGFIAEAATVQALDATLEEAWMMREQWQVMGKTALETAREFLKTDPVLDFVNLVDSKI
ncbi:glycosyltransferase family 4 protein [Pseudomonadota bacterium]